MPGIVCEKSRIQKDPGHTCRPSRPFRRDWQPICRHLGEVSTAWRQHETSSYKVTVMYEELNRPSPATQSCRYHRSRSHIDHLIERARSEGLRSRSVRVLTPNRYDRVDIQALSTLFLLEQHNLQDITDHSRPSRHQRTIHSTPNKISQHCDYLTVQHSIGECRLAS